LIVFDPVIILIAILLFIAKNGTPFFFQDRLSFKEKRIQMVKFKSMNDKKNTQGVLLPDKDYLTNAVSIVNKKSLDELSQLLNVLRGDKNLIGPRPLLFKYLPLYSLEQHKRYLVKLGITGWSQVNGRNTISW
jgi:lipopolysaccharide/colanic/teichoic acid biosynthesis glycosyltransferase